MLNRALEYAKLHKKGKGMGVSEISEKYNESEVTVYKLIRLGEAPKGVISLIKNKKIAATVVANAIKASMTPVEVSLMVENMVKEREEAHQKLEEMGYKGGTSLTLRRALTIAMDNLNKRRLVRGETRKAIVRAFNSIISDTKPTVESIENAVLAS